MAHKKQLLRRVAVVAGTVFLVAGGSLLVGAVLYENWQNQQVVRRTRATEERRAQSRDYLAQVARRISSLPVDPVVPGEVQSKYFEDFSRGRMYVWAVDTAGQLLFGVPAEEFARVDKAYDRYLAEIEKDGFYSDRQSFLRRLIGHQDIDFGAVEGDDETPRWRAYREDEREWPVFSVPIKGENGKVLGTLYLKLEPERWDQEPRIGFFEQVGPVLAVVTVLSGLLLWFLLLTWVYVDARERAMPRAKLWSFLVLISFSLGLILYLIARPEQAKALQCPGCEREIDGGAFCPHCGRDISTAFCTACRYPLKPGWAYCPSCRTEIRSAAAPPPPVEAATQA